MIKRFISTVVLSSFFIFFTARADPVPVTTVRMPQKLVDVLLNNLRSDILPEIHLNLNPVAHHLEIQGKAKVSFVKLYNPKAQVGEYNDPFYPDGIPFKVVFEIECLDDDNILLTIHHFEVLEGEMRLVLYDRDAPDPGILPAIFGIFRFFVEETKFRDLIADKYSENILFEGGAVFKEPLYENALSLESERKRLREASEFNPEQKYIEFLADKIKFKFKVGALAKLLPHPEMENLKLWHIGPYIDREKQNFSLEIVLGKGNPPSTFREHVLARKQLDSLFHGFGEFKEESSINYEQTISLEGLNLLMASLLPLINNEERQAQYERKEASLVSEMSFQFNKGKELGFRLVMKRKEAVRHTSWNPFDGAFWSSYYTDEIKEDVIEVRGVLEALADNFVKLNLNGGQLKGFKFGSTTIKLFEIFSRWILPRIDDPQNDNEVLNKFVKLSLDESKNLIVQLNGRMFSDGLDLIVHEYVLDSENQTLTLKGEALFQITEWDRRELAKLVDRMNEMQSKIEELPAEELQFLPFHKIYYALDEIHKRYEKSTPTGLEDAMFLYCYSKLFYIITLFSNKEDKEHNKPFGNDASFTELRWFYLEEARVLYEKYVSSYHENNAFLLKRKTFWNFLYYDDAAKAEELFELSKKYTGPL